MKSFTLLFCLIILTASVTPAQKVKHKSEAEIAAMTPAQKVEEWLDEELLHEKYWFKDKQHELIRKYVLLDGIKAVPRIAELINQYDPISFPEGKGKRDHIYDLTCELLQFIDNLSVRLRSEEEGRKAIEALENSIERLRKSKYNKDPNAKYGRNDIIGGAERILKEVKGVNVADRDIKSTLRFVYQNKVSDEELAQFSDFLTDHYPDYPSWSKVKSVKDETELGSAGYPLVIGVMVKPERYHEAYLEFKKTK